MKSMDQEKKLFPLGVNLNDQNQRHNNIFINIFYKIKVLGDNLYPQDEYP